MVMNIRTYLTGNQTEICMGNPPKSSDEVQMEWKKKTQKLKEEHEKKIKEMEDELEEKTGSLKRAKTGGVVAAVLVTFFITIGITFLLIKLVFK